MRIASIAVLLTAILAIIINQIDFLGGVLLMVSSIITCFIIRKYPFWGNWAKYLVLFAIWMSVIVFSSFHMVSLNEVEGRPLGQIDYNRLLSFGSELYFITVLSWLLFARNRSSDSIIVEYSPYPISKNFLSCFLVFLYCLTAYCYVIGLGRMGSEAVVLPFHLGGIINLFRSTLVPAIFALIVENFILRKEQIPRYFIYLFFGWCLFESLAWLSKATIINYLYRAALVVYIYYRPPLKVVIRKSMIIIVIFLVAYPIIGFMRSTDMSSGALMSNIKEAKGMYDDERSEKEGSYNPFISPLNRIFMTGEQYIKDYVYIKNDAFFEFSRLPVVVASGGAAGYQTLIIDGFSSDSHHSSGTTGIMDPLLHGGRGLCYIVIVLIMLFAIAVDKQFIKQRHCIYVQLLGILMGLSLFVNISSLYDSVGLQTFAVVFLGVYLTYRLNYIES